MSGKRYPEEFKIESVKQVTERGYKVREAAQRLGRIRVGLEGALNWLALVPMQERVKGALGWK